ncbi:MAG: hypothetical protein ABJE10_10730 [bacterium]
MSIQDGNTQVADATIPELELNKETLQDLEADGSQVKGGGVGSMLCAAGHVGAGGVATGTIVTSGITWQFIITSGR